MGVRLPAEYQEVEWIGASGYQHFTSNIWLQDGLTVDAVQTNGGGDCYLFGSKGSTDSNRVCFNGHYQTYIQAVYNSYYTYGLFKTDDVFHHIILTQEDKIAISYFDGVEVLNAIKESSNIIEDQNSLFGVFGQRNTNGSFSFGYLGKVSSIKVLKDDNLLANYVPCYRKSDNKPGMYDLVSDTFYINEGTGDFLVGPDVLGSISPWLVARRRLLMYKKPVNDTSPKIVGYDKRYNSSGNIIDNNGSCCTDKYDIVANTPELRILYYFGIVSATISWKNGTPFDYWNITATTEPVQGSIIAINTDQVSFTLRSSLIDDSFAIQVETGKVLFAGINSPYYGKQNIND